MCHLLTSAAAQLAERGPLSAFLTPFDGANLRDMKGRCCVSGSRRGCLSEWLRARVQLAPAPTLRFSCGYRQKNLKKAEKDPRCLLPDVLAPSGKDFLILLPFVTSLQSPFLLSSRLTSLASLICYTSAPALFLSASPPFCSPWCKVVILICLSPADHSPLYLSNYLSALSSRPTPPSIQSASM